MTDEKITIESLTRQEQLVIWLLRRGWSQSDIARKTNTAPQTVGKWLGADTIPPFRHQQLVDLGIPAALLPPAEYKTGGRTTA